ncbi:MAG: glycosyltransferase family 4 protein, partial [Anaerolineales bacterium]
MHIGLISRSQTDYTIDLANGFDAAGNPVTLYLDYVQAVEELGSDEQLVERLYDNGVLPKTCKVRLLHLPRMRDYHSFFFFRELAHAMMYEDKVDVLHILLNPGEIWLAVLALLLKDIPVVTTIIVPVANTGERLPGSVVWGTNRIAAFGSDMVIVNGSNQVELVKHIYGIPSDQVSYIPLSLYARSAKWHQEKILEEPGTILFFGRA